MSLQRQFNKGVRAEIVWECDGCDDTLETGTDDFAEARDELKAERWRTRKDDTTGDWKHYCPICQPEHFAHQSNMPWWERD